MSSSKKFNYLKYRKSTFLKKLITYDFIINAKFLSCEQYKKVDKRL